MSGAPTRQIAALLGQAVQAMQGGQFGVAEAVLRRVLSVARNEPTALRLLGRLLAMTGRAADAVGVLRAAVRLTPDAFDAWLTLGQAQTAAGELAHAEKSLRTALKLQPGSLPALLELGGLLNSAKRPQEGEEVLRGALRQTIADPFVYAALEHNLAVALKMQRRHEEALPLFDAALARMPDLPLAEYNRANTLVHLGRPDEAAAGYRRFLARNPMHAAAHRELNELLYRQARDAEFLTSYDDAARRVPEPAPLLMQKGGFLIRAERFDEARDCFLRAAAGMPGSSEAQNGLALAASGLGDFDGAMAAYERSLVLRPGDPATRANLAVLLLRMAETRRALTITEDVVRRAPHDQGALAVHELALRANDDPRAAILADYERHVQVFDLEPPAGFSRMMDFNAALDAYLDTLHTDRREHIDQTLRQGTQTLDPLFEGDNPLIAALRQRIEEAVAIYIARLGGDATHPLSARRADGFRFTGSWSSRLRDHGFHTNHIHPKGWISSCYYVAVPDVAADETAKQGWIKFGEPAFETTLRDPVRRTVKPVAGRLVLFPSYMWHGTVPFRAPIARTTIAFDAVPR